MNTPVYYPAPYPPAPRPKKSNRWLIFILLLILLLAVAILVIVVLKPGAALVLEGRWVNQQTNEIYEFRSDNTLVLPDYNLTLNFKLEQNNVLQLINGLQVTEYTYVIQNNQLILTPVNNAPVIILIREGSQVVVDPGVVITQPPVQAGSGDLRLLLVGLEKGEPSNGWVYYRAFFAIENAGGAPLSLRIDSGAGTVETQEGYTYPTDPLRYDRGIPIMFGDPLNLPPGFRMRGSTDDVSGFDNVLFVDFRAADTAHPTSIRFERYGAYDLGAIQSPRYPTDGSVGEYRLGDAFQVPGSQARLTFLSADLTQHGIYRSLTVRLRMENLDAGYDTSLSTPACQLFDGQGYIRYNHQMFNLIAGPGQTSEFEFVYYLWHPKNAFRGDTGIDDAAVQTYLSGARLVCFGGFEAIVNLGW